MNWKRLIGILSLVLGIYLISYSIHAMHEINEAKGFKNDLDQFFNHNPSVWNPLIEFFGGKAQEEISQYDTPVLIMLISGIVLSIGGFVTAVFYWNQSKRR